MAMGSGTCHGSIVQRPDTGRRPGYYYDYYYILQYY